jgi:hypothetical protein
MRVRKLSPSGDIIFGGGLANFYVNSATGVGQKVVTRLKLIQNEWFLDKTAGTPWFSEIFGYSNPTVRDLVIKNVILTTDNVNEITSYSSSIDTITREYTVSADINTTFGSTSISTSLPA